MKPALAVACAFTLLATVYLTVSLIVLQPPRANDQQWTFRASVIVAQGVLTLTTLAGVVRVAWIRWLLLAGGIAIMLLGASWVRDTVAGPHFEGYALVLGSALVLQGALTLGAFMRLQDFIRSTEPGGRSRPASAPQS